MRHHEVVERKRAEKSSNRSNGLQPREFDRVMPGKERGLIDRAISPEDFPAGLAQDAARLEKDVMPIEGLNQPRWASGMAHFGVEFIQTYQVEVIRRGEIEQPAWPGDTSHFANGGTRVAEVFYGFAGNHNVK